MVVQHGGQQVVGGTDGVEVTREVEVDILHGDDLGVTAAGRAALDTEHGAQRGLTEGHDHVLADLLQTVGQTDGGGGLTLARGGGGDGGDENELTVLTVGVLQQVVVYLCLVLAVLLQVGIVHARHLGDLGDGLHGGGLGDLDIG